MFYVLLKFSAIMAYHPWMPHLSMKNLRIEQNVVCRIWKFKTVTFK